MVGLASPPSREAAAQRGFLTLGLWAGQIFFTPLSSPGIKQNKAVNTDELMPVTKVLPAGYVYLKHWKRNLLSIKIFQNIKFLKGCFGTGEYEMNY